MSGGMGCHLHGGGRRSQTQGMETLRFIEIRLSMGTLRSRLLLIFGSGVISRLLSVILGNERPRDCLEYERGEGYLRIRCLFVRV
jgi:hypothetical protein